jgi:outer membrane receptor for ferric coprogen and ferric-rhodotorulic acid
MLKNNITHKVTRLSVVMATVLYAGTVLAEVHQHQINIPAQRLDLALQALAQQSGAQILFVSSIANTQSSTTLSGQLTVEQALAQLLKGKNLQVKKIAENKYSIVEEHPLNVVQLAPITVDSSSADEDNPVQLPVINIAAENSSSYAIKKVTIGKTEQSLKEIPQSVSVIGQQQIEDQGFTTIAEALEQATGVKSYGYIGSESYLIRLSTANALVDGVVRSTMPSNEDPALYEQIEVLKGPAGLLAGSGEPGGAINYVRKRPQKEIASSVAASISSWNSYRSEFDVTGSLNQDGSWRGRLVGVYNDQGKFYDHAKNDDKTSIYAITEYDINEKLTLGLAATHIDENYVVYWGLPLDSTGRVPARDSFAGYNTRSTRDQNEISLDLKYQINDAWLFKAAYSYRNLKDNYLGAYSDNSMNADGLTDVNVGALESNSKEKGYDVNISGKINLFNREHQLIVGYNYAERDWVSGYNYTMATNWDILNNFNYDSVVDTNIVSKSQTVTEQSGLYVSTKSKIFDPVTLVLGGRWSDYQQKTRTVAASTSAWTTSAAQAHNEFTPYAGLVWDINHNLTWYVSYADTFVPQTEQNFAGRTLDPKVGWQVENGLKAAFFDGALNASAAVFLLREKNRAMVDVDHVGCGGTSTGLCYRAAGEIESRGYEVEISGKPSKNINLTAGYTYNDATYRQDANTTLIGTRYYADAIPKQLLKVWSNYTFDERLWKGTLNGWNVGVGLQTQSDLYNNTGTRTIRQGGFSILSAKLGYKINSHWQASFNINNLLDKTYLNYPGYDGFYNMYGEPRNFMLTLRGKF